MKSILQVLFLILSNILFAQVNQDWVQRFNPNGGLVKGLAIDSQGNTYIAGGRINANTAGDILLIKYDRDGDQVWLKEYAGPGNSDDGAQAIAIDNNDNIYVTGRSNNDIITIKYNLEGEQQWVKFYDYAGVTSFERGQKIIADGQGNVYTTGQSENRLGSSIYLDIVTIKYNSDGMEQWAKRYNGPSDSTDVPNAIDVDQLGNVYVTGESQGLGTRSDLVVLKYDNSGNQLWAQRYDRGTGADLGYDVKVDVNGNVFVTGGSAASPPEFSDFITIKYSPTGQQLWTNVYAGPNIYTDIAYSLVLDNAGDIYVTGPSIDADFTQDWVTIKYDSNGAQQWLQRTTFPGLSGSNIPRKIKTGSDGSVYVTGKATNPGFGADYTTIKYNNDGEEQWIMRYSGITAVAADEAIDMALDENSNVYITGMSNLEIASLKYSQGLNITNPIEGDKWIAGEADTIRWTGGQAGKFLIVEYSTDNGATYVQIDAGAPADSNYYVWKIPKGILTTKAKIKLTDVIYPEDSIVSGTFRIKGYILTRMSNSGNYDAYTKFRDPYTFGNDSASVWPIDFWQNFDYTGTDPFTGYNYLLGFPYFFLQSNSEDHPDWVSWVRTFGISSCYYNTSFPPVYSPTAVNRWFNNRDEWNGSCFGISHSNVLLFNHKTQFLNTYPSFPSVNPLQIIPDDSVLTVINELYAHQMGREHRIYRATVGLLKTPNQTLREIKTMLLDDNPLVRTLSIVSNDTTDPGGHSIMAYKVEQDTTQSNIFYVFTYDNSYPNNLDSAIIVVDTLANNNNGTWTPIYAWTNWGGTKWFYLREPAINYLVNPSLPKNQATVSPFILGENELQILNTRKASISITDQQGNTSGYVNGILINNIPGAMPNIIENGSSGPPIGYDLPVGNYSVKVNDYEDENAFISFYNSNKSFMISRSTVQNTDNDRYYVDGGISVTNPDQQLKNINLLNIVNESIQEKVFFINDLELAQSDSFKIFNPDDNTLDLISYGSVKEYQLELNLASASGLGRFLNNTIQLSQNTTHRLVPNWTDLTNSPLTIYVDEENDGTIDDTLLLVNQVTGMGEDQGSLLTPNSYNLAQNYPNPFNPVTTIQYSIPRRSNVTLKVYDILGNEIAELVNEEKGTGVYSVTFDASGLASGLYLYKLQTDNYVETKKMILLK